MRTNLNHKVIIFCILMLTPFMLYGSKEYPSLNEIPAIKRELITEYMRLMRADVLVQTVLKNNLEELKSNDINIDMVAGNKLINVFSDFNLIIEMYAPIYNKHLKEKDLENAVNFFKTPSAQKLLKLQMSGNKYNNSSFSPQEIKTIKEFQNSESWKEIEKQTPALSRDSLAMTSYIVKKILEGKYKP